MSLEEYISEIKNRLDNFQKDYQKNLDEKIPFYPEQLNYGEWFEQFTIFEETNY